MIMSIVCVHHKIEKVSRDVYDSLSLTMHEGYDGQEHARISTPG